MNKKTIWITGGSTGIGKALAIKFASEGWNVAISARRENLLKEISLVLDKKLDIQEVVGTPGDFMGSVSEISKLKKDLGFKPNYDLKTGLKLFNDWLDHGKISAN